MAHKRLIAMQLGTEHVKILLDKSFSFAVLIFLFSLLSREMYVACSVLGSVHVIATIPVLTRELLRDLTPRIVGTSRAAKFQRPWDRHAFTEVNHSHATSYQQSSQLLPDGWSWDLPGHRGDQHLPSDLQYRLGGTTQPRCRAYAGHVACLFSSTRPRCGMSSESCISRPQRHNAYPVLVNAYQILHLHCYMQSLPAKLFEVYLSRFT